MSSDGLVIEGYVLLLRQGQDESIGLIWGFGSADLPDCCDPEARRLQSVVHLFDAADLAESPQKLYQYKK